MVGLFSADVEACSSIRITTVTLLASCFLHACIQDVQGEQVLDVMPTTPHLARLPWGKPGRGITPMVRPLSKIARNDRWRMTARLNLTVRKTTDMVC